MGQATEMVGGGGIDSGAAADVYSDIKYAPNDLSS